MAGDPNSVTVWVEGYKTLGPDEGSNVIDFFVLLPDASSLYDVASELQLTAPVVTVAWAEQLKLPV